MDKKRLWKTYPFLQYFLVREVSLPCGAKPIRPVGSERRDFAIAFPPIARWNSLCRALPCLRSGNVVNPIRELLRFRCSMMHTLFCSKIKLQFPFISRAVSQPSDRLPRQQKKQSQLALPFCWCGRRDCDSRRELRALVVRRENSSTGRVFYAAPTSSPTTLIKQKQPEINSGCLCLVRETGLEPVRWKHTPLKRARLPIPPLPRTIVLYHKRF